jgi:hypothetical protein
MDNIILHFQHLIEWLTTAINQVGAGTSTGFRTIPTPAGTVYYVRKFGTPYLITDVTDIEDPIDVNMTFKVYANDGTLMGSRVGGGAFVLGSSVTNQGCYMQIVANGGNVTVLNNILVDTNVDAGGLDFITAQETIYNGNTLTLYLSDTSSTYYDSTMQHGGGRHTPVAGNLRKPFFHPYDSLNDGGWGNTDGIEIVDSETYSFPYKDNGGTWRYELPLSVTPSYLYSSDGKEPKIKGIIGADTEREVSGLFNNETAVFFNENGTNVDTAATGYEDTWHDPYDTITNAKTAATNKGITNIIYGGEGAIVNPTIEGNFSITGNNAILESEYGYIPIIGGGLNHSGGNEIIGLTVNGGYIKDYGIDGSGDTYNCTVFNCEDTGIYNCGNNVINCKSYNNAFHGIHTSVGGVENVTLNIKNCLVYNNAHDGIKLFLTGGFGTATLTAILINIISYNNERGIFAENAQGNTLHVTFNNNICFKNTNNGFELVSPNSLTSNNCIYYGNGSYGIFCNNAKTIGYCNFFENGTNYNANITSNNEILTDPKFCKITTPYYFGLQVDSPCWKAGSDNDNIGVRLRIIEINADVVEINGIQIDCNSQFNNAIYVVDVAHHKDCIIKWCNIFNFRGIGIDVYDNADTDWIISNNKIYSGGIGIKLSRGGNTLNENIIYNNLFQGICLYYTIKIFNHNVFFGNKYSIYCASNCGGILIKNCIFLHDINGIYSEVNLILNFCCIIENYTSNIDITAINNITNNPNFLNISVGNENFHLKTKADGYNFNSAGKDAADDGYDIGAYLVTRSISDDSWKKYQLANDPTTVDRKNQIKGLDKSEYIQGKLSLYGKAHKKVIPLVWNGEEYSTEEQYDTLEYMSSLIQTEENEIAREETKIRCLLLPDTHYETGSSATVDATEKTITLASKNWTWNKYKGWWVDIVFESDTSNGTITAATKKLQVAPSPAWTNNEWVGYIFYHNYRYYFITANDADELTLSDPDGTLTNEANIDWQIQQSFKISKHNKTVLTVLDPDSKLISGSYNFVIDFMECVLQKSVFGGKQLRGYDFTEKEEMTGYAVILEEN